VKEGLYYFLTPLLQIFVSILFRVDTMIMSQKLVQTPICQEKYMLEQSLLLKLSSPELADNTTSRLRQEYQAYQNLFQAQPMLVQQYFGIQASALAEAIIQGLPRVHFVLPEHVACLLASESAMEVESIPIDNREQVVGRRLLRLTYPDLRTALCQRLSELEHSSNQAVSVSAILLQYAIAIHMIYNMLPAGRSVIYASVDGDDIPNQPVEGDFDHISIIAGQIGAYAKVTQAGEQGGEVLVPYVEAARRFYLPQWVAFDSQGHLLLGSVREAEAHIASMQHYLAILNTALMIAPYMIADETCQQKRYGMLGQLVNQGRALAQFQSQQIIQTINRRVAEHKLDRGLRLSLPYFNDQTLAMEECNFEVIPAGRIMFVPAFVVLAVQHQGAKVAQDIHFSQSTRRHLLSQLSKLEQAFLR